MHSDTPSTSHPFTFTGNGIEYFKIWIVNVFLTLMTLGIYSAWAKVRTNRYIYGHTVVADSSFDYLASPMKILKGRLIAMGFFVAYLVASGINPALGALFSLVLLLFLPWMLVLSLRFHHHNSAYRNIRFRFHASTADAWIFYIINILLLILTLGLYLPFFMHKYNEFVVKSSAFGQTTFDYAGFGGRYYTIYLKGIAVIVAFLLAISAVSMAIGTERMGDFARTVIEKMEAAEAYDDSYDEETFVHELSPSIEQDDFNATSSHDATENPAKTPTSIDSLQMRAAIALLAFVGFIYMVFILFSLAHFFVQPLITNYVYSVSSLKTIRFHSELHAGKMLWIMISNAFAVLLTLGLLYPWAKVRLLRYRLSKLTMIADTTMEDFEQTFAPESSSTAQEVGDAFDFDFGF